ncbi:hypothetical protein [Polyangium jinanense]|uniref:Uncharacterized protein n=1 Tax=Polyangium jinanense TaxID=2829994 RepID=A0A9X3X4Z1_9BACT|nr:hypothetical protein [Polyangium jinanense]MDC3957672.1 hypothetical protein [Polyangium jinanense]MDC3984372.1 hypothetical protein [Polyangium jinanense]
MRSSWLASLIVPAALVATLPGCEDNSKEQEQAAGYVLDKLVPVANEDAAQVRRGLPEGAKKLGEVVDSDPGANLVALQKAVRGARASVKDLDIAKSTFFTFVDTTGIALRSEADPDLLAQKSVLSSFPSLKKALEPSAGVVEAWGEMQEMRGVRTGPDTQWVVAHPVKDKEGQVKGMFVTGWSFRRFALHLEEMAKRELLDRAAREKQKKVPIVYVFLVRDGKAYGAPVTPDVNAQAIEGLDLANKTQSGPFRGALEITNRSYGIAAQRMPDLGEGTILSVMASAI